MGNCFLLQEKVRKKDKYIIDDLPIQVQSRYENKEVDVWLKFNKDFMNANSDDKKKYYHQQSLLKFQANIDLKSLKEYKEIDITIEKEIKSGSELDLSEMVHSEINKASQIDISDKNQQSHNECMMNSQKKISLQLDNDFKINKNEKYKLNSSFNIISQVSDTGVIDIKTKKNSGEIKQEIILKFGSQDLQFSAHEDFSNGNKNNNNYQDNYSVLNKRDYQSDQSFSMKSINDSNKKLNLNCQDMILAVDNTIKMTTRQLTNLYKLKKKQEKYNASENQYLQIKNQKKIHKTKYDTPELFEAHIHEFQDLLEKLLQQKLIMKKYKNTFEKLDSIGTTNIFPSPSLLVEIRLGEQVIVLNSSFLNSNEQDRLKVSMIVNYNTYYKPLQIVHHIDCKKILLEEKCTNKIQKEQIKDIQLACSYYKSQNHLDGKKVSEILETLMKKFSVNYHILSYSQEKVWIKKLSERTKTFIKKNAWNIRKFVITPETNYEQLQYYKLSNKILELYGLNIKETNLKSLKTTEILQSFNNSMKTTHHVDFMINRYQPSKKTNDKISNLNINYPIKVFDKHLYWENLNGDTININSWIWYESYYKNMKEYIVKYAIIFKDGVFPSI